MAHSVVKVTDAMLNDSLLLLVGEDGTVTPDRETVENYLNSKPGATNIQLMHINKTDKKGIDISVDHFTFIPDAMNEVEVNGPGIEREPLDMEEVARNLHNFQLDHDYITSIPLGESKLEDLVQTLEENIEPQQKVPAIILDNTLLVPSSDSIATEQVEPLSNPPETETETVSTTETEKVSTTTPSIKGKAKLINTEKEATPKETTQKVVEKTKTKEKPKIVQQIEKEFDDDFDTEEDFENDDDFGFEDDENDSDFEIEQPKLKTPKKTQPKRKSQLRERTPRGQGKGESKQHKIELKLKDSKPLKPQEAPEQPKVTEKPSDTTEKDKATPVVDKKVPKKEKKIPKPIPNDFMLFSTPDIIKRVGSKDSQTIGTPSSSSTNSPAKISLENRSRSSSADQSTVSPNKSSRSSVDGRIPEKDKPKQEIKNKDRRQSSDKSRKNSIDEKSKTTEAKKESAPKSNRSLISHNLSLTGDMDLEMATPEDIRSIIMTEDVKSYTTSTLPLVQTSEISSTESVDQNIALDDLDQSILDNINNDEISEDILYQVAQSLVGNTDLQKAIDKGLNEGNLVLDPTIQETISTDSQVSQQTSQTSNSQEGTPQSDIIKKGTQIVRPDGRIVIIPPIERPTTRSRGRKKNEEPETPKLTKPIKPLDNEHVSGNELDSSEAEDNQEEEESEDDPNKLWCICNQPHNNRFMICCDTCEEWYHGKCVNITKAMGQQMEEEGKEWICLFCKNPSMKRPAAAARRIRKASRASIDSAESSKKVEKKKVEAVVSKVSCIVCQKPARENSIYCSQSCILAHASGVEKPRQKQQVLTQSKLKLVKNTEDQGVSLEVRKKGVKVGALKHLPKHEEPPAESKSPAPKPTAIRSEPLQAQKFYAKTTSIPGTKKAETTPVKPPKPTTPTLNKIPKLVQSTLKTTATVSIPKEKPQPVKTAKPRQPEQQQQQPTAPQVTTPKQENIRENVQKTLFEQLTNRIKLDGTIKLTEDEVKEISNEIESQLYKCFGDTGQKYRNKYRSLIFNIKDVKNHTLWKRICEKSVNAYQLVRLSPDDLASQELALWREREAKHSLDMIKKSELELLNFSRQYVLKTHKGEQVVDDENRQDKVDNTEVIRTLTEDHSSDVKDSKSDGGKESQKKSSSKHGHRGDRKSSKDRSVSKDHKKHRRSSSRDRNKDKERSRSRRSSSKDRSSKKDRKRSRSRERYRKSSHKSSRHKKETSHISSTDKLDKKSKEILEQLVDNKIVPPLEDRLWKHVPQEDVVPGPAESDSDHEPSSTVTIPTPPHNIEADDQGSQSSESKTVEPPETKEPEVERSMSPPLSKKQPEEIWRGTIGMIDVAHLTISAQEVSGDCSDLSEQLPGKLEIVGRISPETVWEYIGKMKCSNSKIISLVRLTAVDVVEKMPYLALYSYLSSRKRLGVVKSTNKAIKDFYILPLAPQTPIPQALLPINGPGFEESRPALLLGIIVRDKRKRGYTSDGLHPLPSTTPKKQRIGTPPLPSGAPLVAVELPQVVEAPPRSYTPPSMVSTPPPSVSKDPRIKLAIPTPPVLKEIDDGDEPYSPEDSDPDNTIVQAHSFPVVPDAKPTISLPMASSFDYTPVIPGLDVGGPLPATPLEIQKQMEELNKKIEAQKSEINSISKNIVSASSEIGHSALANIALPSNLQQILDSIKTISTEGNAEEPRAPPKPADPSLTIPLMLPKSFTRPPPPIVPQHPPPVTAMLPDFSTNTIPLKLPTKPKMKAPSGDDSPGLLSSLTEEELVKKAAEMLGETELTPSKHKSSGQLDYQAKRPRLDNESSFDIEPAIPGIDN
ncbi:death-inducer obliterator 1 isoform X2 [Coccinella septempunctata]|uniref:death-inducer obliterator 1 isoform X2 n=1 Tax=Coccinella septempunctata TaxID=41139 RepID=UPI001D0979E9|nr:death-inducer obliterator 1 isoform X2 [Coccinella septempunctata]